MGKKTKKARAAPAAAAAPAAPPPAAVAAPAGRVERLLTPRRTRWAAGGLLLLYLVLALTSMRDDSPTVDEFIYPAEGLYYFHAGNFKLNPENPPLIKQLGGIAAALSGARFDIDTKQFEKNAEWDPWVLATEFMSQNLERFHGLFVRARLVPILLGLLMAFFVFRWARELWGPAAGLLSLLLCVLCPNIMAHARLLTPDVAVACFMFLASYFLWRAMTAPSWRAVLLLGLAAGLAFSTKHSANLLVVILPVQAVLLAAAHGNRLGALLGGRRRAAALLAAACAALVALLVVNACFFFSDPFVPLRDFSFTSGLLKKAAAAVPWLRFPVPREFIMGIDAKFVDSTKGEYPGYLFGQWANEGWRSFFVLSFLTKMPLAGLAFCLVALAWWKPAALRREWATAAFLWVPAVLFLALSSTVFHRINYGLRYLLPFFPLVYVACGRAAPLMLRAGRVATGLLVGLAAWFAVASFSIYPHYLAYFNETIGPGSAPRAFVDSNLDWGQDLKRLKDWMDETGTKEVHLAYFGHVFPSLYGIDFTPLTRDARPKGTIAVSASLLMGLPYAITYEKAGMLRFVLTNDFAWLRAKTPVAKVGYSIYVYRND